MRHLYYTYLQVPNVSFIHYYLIFNLIQFTLNFALYVKHGNIHFLLFIIIFHIINIKNLKITIYFKDL